MVRKILYAVMWSVAVIMCSCSDSDSGSDADWFQTPEVEVSGSIVTVSCRTGFAESVLATADAGFAYAPVEAGSAGNFVQTNDVTVEGNLLSGMLTGLEAETTYLVYAYVALGADFHLQSVPVMFRSGPDPVLPDEPVFGQPNYTDVTASSAQISGSFEYKGDKTISEAYFMYGEPSNDGQRVDVTTSLGEKSARLTGLKASTTYNFRLMVVAGGTTYGGKVGTFTTLAQGGQGGTKYTGWAELPVEKEVAGDYYYAYHLRADAPKIRNFSVCYSAKYRCPIWIAAPMHDSYTGKAKRKDNYIDDPDISCTQNTEYNYSSTNLTRGHMLGSSDRTVSQATNNQVFYKSNIGPQIQSGFNTGGGLWNKCESWVDGQWVNKADTTYQVIGCYWENESKTVNGTTVPTHYYKVLLRTKNHVNKWVVECSRDELQCVAVFFPHNSSNGGTEPSQYISKGFVMSVSDLEKKTGLTYFGNVPNAPKDSFNPADWGL